MRSVKVGRHVSCERASERQVFFHPYLLVSRGCRSPNPELPAHALIFQTLLEMTSLHTVLRRWELTEVPDTQCNSFANSVKFGKSSDIVKKVNWDEQMKRTKLRCTYGSKQKKRCSMVLFI